MHTPLATCIVGCHNYAHHLPCALRSLFAQSVFNESDTGLLEIVLCDDGSTDDSVDVARGLAAEFPGPPDNYRVLAHPHSGSPARTRNRGLAKARGEFCFCLDADDELEPDYVAACLAQLQTGSADVAYTDYVEFGNRSRKVTLPDFDSALLAHQNILTPCALFRKTSWEQAGGWPEGSAYEDWDFWVRLAAAGNRFAHLPRPLFRYRVHASNFTRRAQSRDASAKSAIVLGSPGFFAPSVRAWARSVADGTPDVFPVGVIPRPIDLP